MKDISIVASVGENAKNRNIDVITVQKALNHVIRHNILFPLKLLKEDGIAGRDTKMTIRQFQRVSLGMSAPDGRIDANGKTLKQLNNLLEATTKVKSKPSIAGSLINWPHSSMDNIYQEFNRIQYGILAGVIIHKCQTLNSSTNNNRDLRTLSKSEFVKQVFQDAKKEELKSKVPAAITTAQAILETGYGKSVPTDIKTKKYSYNLFGIKGIGPAGFVSIYTHEYINGKKIQIEDKFKAYGSFSESISGRTDFLTKNKRYKFLFDSTDPKKWAEGLQEAGYATDPSYSTKLINIMNTWKLI